MIIQLWYKVKSDYEGHFSVDSKSTHSSQMPVLSKVIKKNPKLNYKWNNILYFK